MKNAIDTRPVGWWCPYRPEWMMPAKLLLETLRMEKVTATWTPRARHVAGTTRKKRIQKKYDNRLERETRIMRKRGQL